MSARQGVLWDMDGVLVDTGELHFQTWAQVLPQYGIQITTELFQATFGMNNFGVLSALLGREPEPALVAEIGGRKEREFRQLIRGRVEPLPGVRVWLERLKADDVPQAIASSAPPANIEVLLGELDIGSYFAAVVSGFDLPGKPNPSVFLKAAHLIGVPPERCVVVEDATAGVQAAKRAGMKCVAVTTSSSARALCQADIVVARLDALPADTFRQLLARAGA